MAVDYKPQYSHTRTVKGFAVDGGSSLINIAGKDFNAAKFKGAAGYTLTFIGESVNEREIESSLNCQLD